MTKSGQRGGQSIGVEIDGSSMKGRLVGVNLSPESSQELISIIRETGRSKWFWIAVVIVPPLTALAARTPEIICAVRGLEGCA